jgi:hypothetical protein
MSEMPVKTHFDTDKGEDIHNGTRDDFGHARAVAPGQTSGGQDAEKWKADRQDRHNVGTRAQSLRVLPLGEDSHGNCRGGNRLLWLGPITGHSSYGTWRSIGWPFGWGGYYTKAAYFCTAEDLFRARFCGSITHRIDRSRHNRAALSGGIDYTRLRILHSSRALVALFDNYAGEKR